MALLLLGIERLALVLVSWQGRPRTCQTARDPLPSLHPGHSVHAASRSRGGVIEMSGAARSGAAIYQVKRHQHNQGHLHTK